MTAGRTAVMVRSVDAVCICMPDAGQIRMANAAARASAPVSTTTGSASHIQAPYSLALGTTLDSVNSSPAAP